MTVLTSPGALAPEQNFASFSRTLDRQISIAHWQLRDLVSCSRDGDALYTVFGPQTFKHDIASDTSQPVQNLVFKPVSMACNEGYIAVGGQHQELEVMQLSSSTTIFKDSCGHSVNNALHISRDLSGEPRLFVSNNDKSVRVFSLPRMALIDHIQALPAAVNYSALSPDARHLAFVGDCDHTFIYAATPTGHRRLRVFAEARDCGMCCSWNAAGSCLAAAAQDGSLCVWDVRSHKLVAKYSAQAPLRAVKFSSGPVDLLAFTEHTCNAHLVDSRMYGSHQMLQLQQSAFPDMEINISGVAFNPMGSRLYIGTEHGINELAVDTVLRRSFKQGCII